MPKVFTVHKHHSEIVSKGTLFKVLKYLDRGGFETPVLLLDREKVREKAALIGSRIRGSRVFYAVKANPDAEVLRYMETLGLGFEIASDGELAILAGFKVDPSRIISSNPVKSFRFLEAAASYGVCLFSFDSEAEVDKLATVIPGAQVYVRLSVPNEGSEWPLSRKFGVEMDQALGLLRYAAEKGLDPVGITFHVGSQCHNIYSWSTALYKTRALWEQAEKEGLRMRVLNIGGGYPINYTKGVVGVEPIEKNIDKEIRANFPDDVEVFIEPGRAMVGDAGVFVSRVIGKTRRAEESWLHIDVGVFNGMMESVGGIKYSYLVEEREGAEVKGFVVCGPSCDSFDVLDKDVQLADPEVGSLVLVLAAGAYTISYASEFNGFAIPKTVLV